MSQPDQPRVFVTRKIPEIGIARIASVCRPDVWPEDLPPSREALLQKVPGCHALLTLLSDRIDGEVMDAAGPDLKVISNYAVGYNNIDVEEATRRGIRVGNTPGVLTDATADIAAALLFAVGRKIIEANHSVHQDRWKTWEPLGYIGSRSCRQDNWNCRHGTDWLRNGKTFPLRLGYERPYIRAGQKKQKQTKRWVRGGLNLTSCLPNLISFRSIPI